MSGHNTNKRGLQPQGVSWVKQLRPLNQTELDYNDAFYRARLQSLQAVDELVGAVVDKLVDLGMAENTYIMYTSDNGYHMGQHRLQPGKQCAFEEDVNVPFIVRGPGVPQNHSVSFATTHIDVSSRREVLPKELCRHSPV